jgi:hypothetical protein
VTQTGHAHISTHTNKERTVTRQLLQGCCNPHAVSKHMQAHMHTCTHAHTLPLTTPTHMHTHGHICTCTHAHMHTQHACSRAQANHTAAHGCTLLATCYIPTPTHAYTRIHTFTHMYMYAHAWSSENTCNNIVHTHSHAKCMYTCTSKPHSCTWLHTHGDKQQHDTHTNTHLHARPQMHACTHMHACP